MKHLLIVKSDTTIGLIVGQMSELAPDVWDLEREAVKMMVRDGLAWQAGLKHAQLRGPIRWRLLDISNSIQPHFGAPELERGVWE